ncbi:amidohydrolase [Arthrobacter sp. UYEF3]
MDTAFEASFGDGELVIALLAEYDALPMLGHACGHNVSGAISVGAALALAVVADQLGLTVRLLGSPAEEDGGGKVYMVQAGMFDDVAAAMMVHAGNEDTVGMATHALGAWNITYSGVPSHAAAAPWLGRNALDAMTLAHTAIGLLRQQLPPGSLVHGIITDGGQASNVIPSHVRAHYEIRASDFPQLRELQARVRVCFEAGALATGTELTIEPRGLDYAELVHDDFMTRSYAAAAQTLGRSVRDTGAERGGSTDMGNVSRIVPSIHPTIGYDTGGAGPHTEEFAAAGIGPDADRAIIDGALALAFVGMDLARDAGQRRLLLEGVRARKAAVPPTETPPMPNRAAQQVPYSRPTHYQTS